MHRVTSDLTQSMPVQSDVRRLALSLPGAEESSGDFSFFVRRGGKRKLFAWVWLQRHEPKAPRVPNPEVLGVRVDGLDAKEALLASAPDRLFTEPHYDGYPAVLVRLTEVGLDELEDLLEAAWRCQAPRRLLEQRDR